MASITAAAPERRYRRSWRRALTPYLLVFPGVALVLAFFLALWWLALISFGLAGEADAMPSLAQYARILGDPVYRGYYLVSLKLAAYATVLSLLFGYPVAYYMEAAAPSTRRLILIFLVTLFFSDYVMRVYALILVIGNNGLVNQLLLGLGAIDTRLRIMNTEVAVVLGLVTGNIVFMILAIGSVLARLDRNLLNAAALLGAGPLAGFVRITLPLSMPGIVSGSIIVFLLSMNSFLTPALLGGGRVQMVANFVYQQAIDMWNFPAAAAAAVVLLVFSLLLIGAVNLVLDRYGRRFAVS